MGLYTELKLKFPPTTRIDEQKLFITILKYTCQKQNELWGTDIDFIDDELTITVDWDYDDFIIDEMKEIALFLEQDHLIEISREEIKD